jgi:hypothetical protein
MDSAPTNLPMAYFYNREMQKALRKDEGGRIAPKTSSRINRVVCHRIRKFDVAEREFQG